MKKGIHPRYMEATITCACGAVIHTRSTKKEIKVGVCSRCHPFFTGTQKYVDTAGRVEKFMKKYAAARRKKRVRKTPSRAVSGTEAEAAPDAPGAGGLKAAEPAGGRASHDEKGVFQPEAGVEAPEASSGRGGENPASGE